MKNLDKALHSAWEDKMKMTLSASAPFIKKVYKGWLEFKSNGEEDEILGLRGEDGYLAEWIKYDMDEYGQYLSVRYYISEKKTNKNKLQEEWLKKVDGFGDADYAIAHSETTGYLWTDEEIMVGGHDLLEELKSYIGKYMWLEIKYSKGGDCGNE